MLFYFQWFSLLSRPGCPADEDGQECKNPFDIFQGCMRLLSVENQPVDLIKVQQRLLGNYSHLQIDMCGIIDRSVPPETSLTPPLIRDVIFFASAATPTTVIIR